MRITVWSPVNTEIHLDDELLFSIDHFGGFDYNSATIIPNPNSTIRFKSKGFDINKQISKIIDIKKDTVELHIRSHHGDIPITYEEELAGYGDESDIPDLLKRIQTSNRNSERAFAIECLGKIGSKEPVRNLITLLDDLDPYIQARAAFALGEIGDISVLKLLENKFNNYTKQQSYGWMFEYAIEKLTNNPS